MNEPQMEPKRPSGLVKCEKHGLHYDPARMSGCVICRRETGGTAAMPAGQSGSLGKALGVTAVLLVLATAGLYLIHGMAIETFQAWTSQGPADANTLNTDFNQQLDDMGFPAEDAGDGDTYSDPEGESD